MFKKLKEKITEEVKSSPQRFQQLTQSVSDRLQNSSTSDENFFSIGEDDANISSSSFEAGFTNVSLTSPQEAKFRRNSSSSIASDVSFLPRYESVANMYHLQSDLEISASEIEDNASTSSQLGHLTKEQIYAAFQKAQMRYHKYRGRYTDLAKHYKDLERENSKMKSVLVETQDKAIRRVTELKEQCSLEQKAKAHLESALRDEIDEKQFKIQSLQTKIELLQNGSESENLENLNKYLTEARQEIENLNEKIQEMKANSIIFQSREQEYKNKIANLEKEISMFSEREKENNLTLAQNKMELHNELISKDNEISNLKQENEAIKKSLEAINSGNGKMENLQSQNKKLIDRIESLTQKCNTYENDLLKMEQYKIELQNSNQLNSDLKSRIIEMENKLEEVREEAKKSLISLEGKIRIKLQKEFDQKQEEITEDFKRKLDEVSSTSDNVKEIQMSLFEREAEVKKLREVNDKLLEELTLKTAKYSELETNHLELIQDSVNLRSRISNLEKEYNDKQAQQQAFELKIKRLEAEIFALQDDAQSSQKLEESLEELQKEKDESDMKVEEAVLVEEQLKGQMKILQEEKEDVLKKVEDERNQREELSAQNMRLKEEIAELKLSISKREEDLEERAKLAKIEIDEEKEKLLRKLEASENAIKSLEETSSSFAFHLEELKKKNEEIELLRNELQKVNAEEDSLKEAIKKLKLENEELVKLRLDYENMKKEKAEIHEHLTIKEDNLKHLEEKNLELVWIVQTLEEELKNMNTEIENQRIVISDFKGDNKIASDELSRTKTLLENIVEEKEQVIAKLQETIQSQSADFNSSEEKNKHLEETILKLTKALEEKEQETESNGRELKQALEELNLVKKLLEERSSDLTIKEQEMKRIQNLYIDEKAKAESISTLKNELENKDLQIETLSKKIECYNDLMQETKEVFNHVGSEALNNFKSNKRRNFQSLEGKLQNLEQNFSIEKENLSKILNFLKQCEDRYLLIAEEKEKLSEEKQQLLQKVEDLQVEITGVNLAIKGTESELLRLKEENAYLIQDKAKMEQNVLEVESRNTQIVSDNNFISEENSNLMSEIEELKLINEELGNKHRNSEALTNELKGRLETNDESRKQLKELELLVSELEHEKQLLKEEIEELKTSPINLNEKEDNYKKEIEGLRTKVVQYKSLDLTNRSSIEFYENELQKLKNQNEKLNRKLDETLVTLHHCSELSQSTEIEYLKNVLYNYMLGKESLVLARVIAAVCKFDPQQTELILAKEQQKQTLLGQLGIL